MSRYIGRVVGPAGRETYLCRGREVERMELATHYPHPSSVQRAIRAFRDKHRKQLFYVDILDTRDIEREVAA